jgi:response regulator NasT
MRNLKILAVEDEGLVAAALTAHLGTLGHVVVGLAKDGQEAVECASKLGPDLIIMDVRIPIMDGIETSRTILGRKPIPIVLLTAFADESLARRAGEAGVMAYLVKPADRKQLSSTIEVALARFEELDALRREVRDLKGALETRKVVEQAKGVLMNRLKLSEGEAFRRMQQTSRNTRTGLKEVAATILKAEELLAPFEEKGLTGGEGVK